jgi:hypothetical protein
MAVGGRDDAASIVSRMTQSGSSGVSDTDDDDKTNTKSNSSSSQQSTKVHAVAIVH